MNLVFASGFLVPQRVLGQDYFRGATAEFPGACFPRVPVMRRVLSGTLQRAIAVFGVATGALYNLHCFCRAIQPRPS